MKTAFKLITVSVVIASVSIVLSSFKNEKTDSVGHFKFPYKQAGLTERQAAAHLLSRFTFGAKPGEVDAVAKMGLENWFLQQLDGKLPEDDSLTYALNQYESLKMSNQQIVETYPRAGQILREAVKDGLVDKDSIKNLQANGNRKEYRDQIKAYMDKKGYKPEAELFRQLVNQKILRATYSNNQLHELLTDFWFNHFNVSLTKNECSQYVTAYERDAIRPNVTGKFQTILMATAKSPAMLTYLDNFRSVAANNDQNERPAARVFRQRMLQGMMNGDSSQQQLVQKLKNAKNAQGLNENYAREVMELHTLGVDGGYLQGDVTQAARILTGWTIYPTVQYNNAAIKKVLDRAEANHFERQGFVHEGDFMFAANKHDNGEKYFMETLFPADGGYKEGERLLTILAHHPNTAKFISKKLATRFVCDNPPQSLIDKMAQTFLATDGDIKQVLITMATAPEFWSKESLREKTKSPFELAISSLRSLDAHVAYPYLVYNWVNKMGEKLYYYQAPTGFPDKGQYWINTGSLLNRMNFGLALASQRIPGVTFNLAALNNNHEPESAESALAIYGKILMPERDLSVTIQRLTPLINDPNLTKKVTEAANKTAIPQDENAMMAKQTNEEEKNDEAMMDNQNPQRLKEKPNRKNDLAKGGMMELAEGNNSMLSQVVGIIIGSPEYQRK